MWDTGYSSVYIRPYATLAPEVTPGADRNTAINPGRTVLIVLVYLSEPYLTRSFSLSPQIYELLPRYILFSLISIAEKKNGQKPLYAHLVQIAGLCGEILRSPQESALTKCQGWFNNDGESGLRCLLSFGGSLSAAGRLQKGTIFKTATFYALIDEYVEVAKCMKEGEVVALADLLNGVIQWEPSKRPLAKELVRHSGLEMSSL